MRVAPIDLSVLVTGESGSGKEFFPQIIHAYSPRKHAKYIAVNCGAIPEGTIDSELFGHEKGAFTGAVASRKGYFEEANGGTIFLDEMADAIARGKFREDLFYRLATVQITVPPLRDRGEDILLLTRKFTADFADKNRTPMVTFTEDAREAFLRYRWPGNVRQLKNVTEQIALFEAGNSVTARMLADYLPEAGAPSVPVAFGGRNLPVSTAPSPSDKTYEREREMLFSLIFKMRNEIEQLRRDVDELKGEVPEGAAVGAVAGPLVKYTPTASEIPDLPHKSLDPGIVDATAEPLSEKEAIRLSLERNLGRRKAAARELNISERTLYRKIKEYNLE